MKNLTTLVFIAFLVFAATFNTSAQEAKLTDANHRIDVRVNPENKVVLRADLLDGQKRLNYVLTLRSEDGSIIYGSKFLRKKPIYKAFDLSKLPEGKYTMIVSEKLKTIYSKTLCNKAQKDTQMEQLLVEEL